MKKTKDGKRGYLCCTVVTTVLQKDSECYFCLCICSFLFPSLSVCAIQNSCLPAPTVVGLLLLYERRWVFSPVTWFWLCKIITSKALNYKFFRAEITFFFFLMLCTNVHAAKLSSNIQHCLTKIFAMENIFPWTPFQWNQSTSLFRGMCKSRKT